VFDHSSNSPTSLCELKKVELKNLETITLSLAELRGAPFAVEEGGSPREALVNEVNKSEVWWRCRESNPGPTCSSGASTIVVSLVISFHKRETESGAKCVVCSTHVTATSDRRWASLVTPHPFSENRRRDVFVLRRTKRRERTLGRSWTSSLRQLCQLQKFLQLLVASSG